jgi:hypothetical protein
MEAGHATEPANDADQAAGNELHNTGRQTKYMEYGIRMWSIAFFG